MPVTPKFIAMWFMFSSLMFFLEMLIYRMHFDLREPARDDNTLLILFAQGLGASLAYALY